LTLLDAVGAKFDDESALLSWPSRRHAPAFHLAALIFQAILLL
jgi:hypothetical protein